MKINQKLTIDNNFGLFFWAAVAVCFLVQMVLSIYDFQNLIVLWTVLTILTYFYLLVKNGSLYEVPVVIGVLYVFNNIIFAFVLKTLLLQPASSNLFTPVRSYLATFIAILALFGALFVSKMIEIGKPIFNPVKDLNFLKWLSIYSFAVGFTAWVLNQIMLIDRRSAFFDPKTSFGGFAIFDNLFYMSIISSTAYILILSNKKKSFNIYVALLFFVAFLMALIESRKFGVGFTFLSYLLTSISFRQKITKYQITAFFILLLFAFFIFTPIAHTYRSTLWFLPFTQKVNYLYQNLDDISSPEKINGYYSQIKKKRYSRYNYFDRQLLFFDRLAAIQINDDLISATELNGLSKSEFYITDYSLILPSLLYPHKDTIALGDKLRWEHNLKKYGQISFTLAPLISNGYAVGKNMGVFILCFFIFSVLFLILKKINWNLYENVFAIYFFVPFIIGVHEWSHGLFISRMFREIPINIFVLWLFYFFFFKIYRRSSSQISLNI